MYCDGQVFCLSDVSSVIFIHQVSTLSPKLHIGKDNDTRTVQAEISKFASVSFDQGFQIWVGWN